MNTSRKGNTYEWAFKRKLEARQDVVFVLRMAGSHGPFDLVALHTVGIGPIDSWTSFWQLKSGRMTCRAADALMTSLWLKHGMPSGVTYNVVHRRHATYRRGQLVETTKEFCEH